MGRIGGGNTMPGPNNRREDYGGLFWVGPCIVAVHEMSHIIIGKGLNMQYGWYGFTLHKEIPEALFGSIGVFVNEATAWTFASGLIGSVLCLVAIKKWGSRIGLHMTKKTFWVALMFSVWISKWDIKWLAEEIMRVIFFK
jgi:hypothetical protein